MLALTILIVPFPQQAQAFGWDDLWLRSDQRALRELQNGDAKTAAELFRDKAWKGAAQYQAGDYQASQESLQDIDDIEAMYNRGNAEARLGQYQQAISTYDEVLKRNPQHEDAKFNKELLEKELENQHQQQQDQQQRDNEQEQNKQQEDQQQGDGQGENQEQSEESDTESESDSEQDARNQNSQQDSDKEKDSDTSEQDDTDEKDKDVKEEKQKPSDKESESDEPKQEQSQVAQASAEEANEEQQATEQWLRRIPDDPAGLLRRKFLYQYQKNQNRTNKEEKTW